MTRSDAARMMPGSVLLPTTPDYLDLQARRCGDDGGIAFRDHRHPYGRVAEATHALARWLAARGVGAGHHVGL